ncbi:DUF655 domain-containing protein [Candidatus Woesearchaeota archaeon]|nr:MAG: DUF655 domain-containing protein [Candidatus Woesearchaeota archaeon]
MESRQEQRVREEKAIVLDFLPHGYPFDTRPSHKKTPIVHALGLKHFVLLELVPKKDVFLQPLEEVYIGEDKRDKIHHIVGRLPYEKLTATGKNTLELVVQNAVEKDEQRFVKFFNEAKPLTMRMHQLELLPGLGKKHMWEIIERREEKPFESFKDIRERVKLMPDPKKIIVKRIMNELQGKEKHRIFVDCYRPE